MSHHKAKPEPSAMVVATVNKLKRLITEEPKETALDIGYAERSRRATQSEIDSCSRKDPWFQWHVLHCIELVFKDNPPNIQLSKEALRIITETPYMGTYANAKQFTTEHNLKRFVIENGLTYEKLIQVYGQKLATEISVWARQITDGRAPSRRGLLPW